MTTITPVVSCVGSVMMLFSLMLYRSVFVFRDWFFCDATNSDLIRPDKSRVHETASSLLSPPRLQRLPHCLWSPLAAQPFSTNAFTSQTTIFRQTLFTITQ